MEEFYKAMTLNTCCIFKDIQMECILENGDVFRAYCEDLIKNSNIKYFVVDQYSSFDVLALAVLQTIQKETYKDIVVVGGWHGKFNF